VKGSRAKSILRTFDTEDEAAENAVEQADKRRERKQRPGAPADVQATPPHSLSEPDRLLTSVTIMSEQLIDVADFAEAKRSTAHCRAIDEANKKLARLRELLRKLASAAYC
jgi:hypothetical protein